MKLILLQPQLDAPSEVFLYRMLGLLAPRLKAIGCDLPQQPVIDLDGNPIPVYQMEDWPLTLGERVRRRLHITSPIHKTGRLHTMIRKTKPDAIFIQYVSYAVPFFEELMDYQGALFVHCHGSDVSWQMKRAVAPFLPMHKPDYVKKVQTLGSRPKTMFIANSQETVSRLNLISIPDSAIRLKYLGVPTPETSRAFTGKKEINILFLGRLVDCKGPDRVIKAFELACSKGLEGNLTIAGDGYLRITCELQRLESPWKDRIRILGAVDSATREKLMAEADVFTAHNQAGPITSQIEAFGVSIVEAMACSLPVVTGRSGGVQETVVDGDTGYLVTPGDIESHADAFLELANNPDLRKKMGNFARKRVLSHFSLELERERLNEILQSFE